jgi:two-component system CheB/CheR fusion protein
MRELFAALPTDSGAAFVVVSHQASTGKSLLPEILAKTTSMTVREIQGSTRVEPNHVYLVPRGQMMAVRDSSLEIEPIGDRAKPALPIDYFLHSLAVDRGPRSVGIVLSGTGADGTLGLAAIHAESGLCLVQKPETAEFDGMPASAIAAGTSDFILPVSEMPARIVEFARPTRKSRRNTSRPGIAASQMDRILALIHVRGRHDFSAYKRDTLHRRVERRMDLHRIASIADYTQYLEDHGEEIDALWRDLLIGVSSFFRDPDAFKALADVGLPELLESRAGETRFRVWVPGCATGEEAYTIAIVVLEKLAALGGQINVQVFATDLDPDAIQRARTGRYPKTIAATMSADRLARYFVEEEHGYRAKKNLRDRIVFAVQDALSDPPFTRVDLISCRNLLIYVVPDAQQGLLSLFHYSLNPGGLLLLGASEHVGEALDLFKPIDKRWKLFRREESSVARPPRRWLPRAIPAVKAAAPPQPVVGGKFDLTETLRANLADRFAPPAVVVDQSGQILQTHGRVGPYLELPPGRANLSVVEMARTGLRAPLSSALREAAKAGAGAVLKDVRWRIDGRWGSLRLRVERIEGRRVPSPLLLVSFEPGSSRRPRLVAPAHRSDRTGAKQAKLEDELLLVRQDLETSISDLQAANEELASANEEVQSANEELQSSNEELQTSKEETQSLNEELQTVNAELTEKLRGLERANDDLENLMSNLEIATIFLDDRFRVTRFTPQARNVARLIDSDVGRPLADLATLVDYPDLLADAGSVLSTLCPMERQASAPGGVWYTVRIRPYRTSRNAVEGLVVTFIDITEAKRSERIQAARFVADSIVDAVREPLLVLDTNLRVLRANRSFYRVFHSQSAGTEGRTLGELGTREWNEPRLRAVLEQTLRDSVPFEDFAIVHDFAQLGRRRMVLSGRPVLIQPDERPQLIVLGIQDEGPAPPVVEGIEA